MKRTKKTPKEYVPDPMLFRRDAMLPPRFVRWHFSDKSIGLEISSDTVRAWRDKGYLGNRASLEEGRVCISWQEFLMAQGAWSPTGSFSEMQRQPYASEVVAAKLGISHRIALDRFRNRKIPGGFKMGAYWYARATDFDAARALIG
jgi:hypothetical protein